MSAPVEPAQHQATAQDTPFIHPHDKYWSIYLSTAKELDKARLERWKGDSDGILIFTGLFAATVATFVVDSTAQLSPDSASQTVALLAQLVSLANANGTASIGAVVAPPNDIFKAPRSAVCVNSLWYLSLFLALMCALMATMVQQWARRYLHDAQIRGPPHIVGPVHSYLSDGIEHSRFDQSASIIVITLHVSVFLFLAGLLVSLFSTMRTLAATRCCAHTSMKMNVSLEDKRTELHILRKFRVRGARCGEI